MIRHITICGLFLCFGLLARGQKAIDSVSKKSCDCIGDIQARMSVPAGEDSIRNCINRSIIPHFKELSKEKKLNPGTVEGIIETHKRVREMLAKECEAYINSKK
jgi:hypothetical protein